MYAKRVYAINEAHTTDSNQYTPSISEITRTAHYAYYIPAEVFLQPWTLFRATKIFANL
jgi:hypothetical protein